MSKTNNWVWSKLAESKKPDRKEGSSVPLGYLNSLTLMPYASWIKKGYVEKRVNID